MVWLLALLPMVGASAIFFCSHIAMVAGPCAAWTMPSAAIARQ